MRRPLAPVLVAGTAAVTLLTGCPKKHVPPPYAIDFDDSSRQETAVHPDQITMEHIMFDVAKSVWNGCGFLPMNKYGESVYLRDPDAAMDKWEALPSWKSDDIDWVEFLSSTRGFNHVETAFETGSLDGEKCVQGAVKTAVNAHGLRAVAKDAYGNEFLTQPSGGEQSCVSVTRRPLVRRDEVPYSGEDWEYGVTVRIDTCTIQHTVDSDFDRYGHLGAEHFYFRVD